MAQAVAVQPPDIAKALPSTSAPKPRRTDNALLIAAEQGLLDGGRTRTLRGRMPSLLVEEAKRKTGIQSDSKLLELALANIVVGDDYGEWLLARQGVLDRDLDLEF